MSRTTLAALAFVLIWSTGFIVARSIVGQVDPNLFLAVRFALCTALFGVWIVWRRLPLPAARSLLVLAGVGALVQGLYLGPSFWAVSQGLQPGLMALIGALQPPLTALVAARLALSGEDIAPTTWAGLALGVTGVALAVGPALGAGAADVGPVVVLAAMISVLSITAGTLLQRSGFAARVDIAWASAVQSLAACAVVAILAVVLDESRFEINAATLLSLGWAVGVLSIGGFTLLLWLVRIGGATRASSLLFMAPPLAAIMARVLYGDSLTMVQITGFVFALTGVVLAQRRRRV